MRAKLIQANSLKIPLADKSVQTCVTSPPYYGLRDYGEGDQIGLEQTLAEYIENMCLVFDEVWRVLRDDGTCWLNLGDSYNGSGGAGGDYNAGGLKEGQPKYPGRNEEYLKPKDLMGVPWRVAFALQERGWYLRSDIIWHKPNPMPESVTDRPTKAHEYIFLLSKSKKYYYDADAIREPLAESTEQRNNYPHRGAKNKLGIYAISRDREPGEFGNPAGRNKRTVWTVTTKPYKGAHFATFPPDLIEPCILAGTSEKGQCSECGAPWERVVERTGGPPTSAAERISQGIDRKPSSFGAPVDEKETGINGQRNWRPPAGNATFETRGWKPTCTHEAEPVPQIVLDPFGGSGTTAQVSQAHGRIGVCLDLSWEYLQLARERCGLKQMADWQTGKQVEANWQDLPMFKENHG